MSVKECLRELDFFLSLEKRKPKGILLLSSSASWEFIGKMESDASLRSSDSNKRLPREVIYSPSLEIFNTQLGKALSKLL